MPEISHEILEKCRARFGDSFYIVDINKFRANSARFTTALQSYYPKTRFAYSYKTNYIPDLAKAAQELGFYAEVVSEVEYQIARRYGNQGSDIIFNGPIKTGAALESALDEGAIVNLDNLGELDEILQLLNDGVISHAAVGLRASFDMGQERCSRFGLNIECGDFKAACERIAAEPRIRVVGLHCHFSVPRRDTASYRHRTLKLIELTKSVPDPSALRFLDIGGGFAGPMSEELKKEFNVEFPQYEEYAEAVAGEMAKAFPGNDGPELIIEPGMGLLADTMCFVCQVHTLKNSGSCRYAITTGSIFNVKPFLHNKNMPFRHIHAHRPESAGVEDLIQVTGYTCMEIDVLYENYRGSLQKGDFLMFSNCGAYAPILTPAFIRPAPAIVSVSPEISLVRRAQNELDMILPYSAHSDVESPPN